MFLHKRAAENVNLSRKRLKLNRPQSGLLEFQSRLIYKVMYRYLGGKEKETLDTVVEVEVVW